VQELRNGPQGGLAQVLEENGRTLSEHSAGSSFALTVEGLSRPLLPQVEEEACHIAQEALRNAFNHAGPSAVTVLLCFGPEQLLIEVADNGAGFVQAAKEGHWGLVGMRERAERIGASLSIDSAPGAGTRVTLRVPAQLAYSS
jgi:signal transduction histidine kinase